MSLKPPPFDPELEATAATFAEQIRSTLTPEELVELRSVSAVPSNEDLARNGVFRIEQRSVPGVSGAPDVPLLLCRPAAAEGQLPVIYYMHGGGMVMGTNRLGIDHLLEWAQELDVAVVSVEYRLAPEHPYPAARDDCFAGLLWVAQHAQEIGVDPERIIVAGKSGGGGLAAALTLLTRDRQGPRPIGQILMCPMIDDRDTPSAHQMTDLGMWDRGTNAAAWTHVLGEQRGSADVSPYAAAARADDLSGLPPTFLDVGSAETFRDEIVTFASRIWQAGGAADLHVWAGGFHGFDHFVPDAVISQGARAAQLNWLRRILAV